MSDKAITRRRETRLSTQITDLEFYDDLLDQRAILELPKKKFKVVLLNEYGKIINTKKKDVSYFREDLGDGVYLDMMCIPKGRFQMGALDNKEQRQAHEGPVHHVSISAFKMGQYPVTQRQWRQIAKEPKVEVNLKLSPSRFKGENRPVEQVNWYEALEFCARLSRKTGREYRLPTEAEWEYACRAGTTTSFHFGETVSTEFANYNGYHAAFKRGKKMGLYRRETTPVNKFDRFNEYGLVDMHGNVWEWCQDTWHSNYEGAPIDGRAWIGSDKRHILRGGSWYNYQHFCRSAGRFMSHPGDRSYNYNYSFSFRIVLSLPRIS